MQKEWHNAFIGLGSNMGDGRRILTEAWIRLGDDLDVVLKRISNPFLSDPVGMKSDYRFTNCVGCIKTSLAPKKLLELLLKIENEFGRTRSRLPGVHEDRTLDLDLLYYDTLLIVENNLIVPHPRISQRLFVLLPMTEIEPTYVDPLTHKSVEFMCKNLCSQMREGLIDKQNIEKSSWNTGLVR